MAVCDSKKWRASKMGYLILGIIVLAAILIFGGYIVLSVMNAAMWMDDSMRWGGRDDS